ncbi:MAG: DNA replication/repair protein RecF [Clostridia bacterium]
MNIKSIKLKNFRNYSNLSVDFSKNNNIIYGLNAQGKTNLIEAIYFVSTLKSFRTSKNREIIKFNEQNLDIECIFSVKDREYTEKINYSIDNKYKISINGVSYKSRNQVLGKIKTVVFCPDDLYLVKDSPSARRNFLDETLIQFRPKYHKLLTDFNKYIKEKNHILKNLDKKPQMYDLIDDYNAKIAELSAEISLIRSNFLKLLCNEASIIYSEVCGDIENFSLSYTTKLTAPSKSVQQNIEEYEKLLEIYREREKMAKSCLIGCHKDDIGFFINENHAREFASQGQIRSIVLSLKLAVRELHFKDCGVYPILILDDVLSELDNHRKQYVTHKIKNGQVLITTPYIDQIDLPAKTFYIENGAFKE